jgi:hypothetical protein
VTAPLTGGLLLAVRTLDKTQWAPFFDAASNSAVGKRAEIEVALLALGSQIEAEWAPLQGIIYDAQSDIIKLEQSMGLCCTSSHEGGGFR